MNNRLISAVVVLTLMAALVSPIRMPEAQAQGLTIAQVNDQLGVGVNLGNALEGPREGVWGLTLTSDFFTEIAQQGFGHVRVPIRFSAYADTASPFTIPDGIDPTVPNADNLWDRIDWVIANAEANGLYVILDLHHYDELFDNIDGERERFLAIWEQIATRYADAGPSVLFELLNEPHGQFNDDPSRLNPLLVEALQVVRNANPTRPVLVGPTRWNSIDSLGSLELPDDPNLIVSVHFYEPFAFTHQGADWIDPVRPAPVSFDRTMVGFGAGWGNWSWDTAATATPGGLEVAFGRQWAGLGFGRGTLIDPATINVTIAGEAELSVRCANPQGDEAEVELLVTTATSFRYEIDMSACPGNTESVTFMAASAAFDVLVFESAQICSEAGECSRMLETAEQAIESAFDTAQAWGQANNRPINVGEFGAYSANGTAPLADRAEWTTVVRTAGRNRGFSMSYWEFGAGFGVYDPFSGTWVQPLLQALGVTPGTPSTAICNGQPVTIDMRTNGGIGIGTSGDDVIMGTVGADIIDAGDGNDTVCAGDGDDTVEAGPGNDVVLGEGGNDRLFGRQGADDIAGGVGDDVIHGNKGNDVLAGQSGVDRIFGYAGNDEIDGGSGNDRLHGNFGDDVINGGDGDDRIFGYGDQDRLSGGTGDDLISGNFGDDVIDGDAGNDTLFGADGDDTVNGGAGDDIVNGNSLNDTLTGGPGNDTLDGGINVDSCDGGANTDIATRCETLVAVP